MKYVRALPRWEVVGAGACRTGGVRPSTALPSPTGLTTLTLPPPTHTQNLYLSIYDSDLFVTYYFAVLF